MNQLITYKSRHFTIEQLAEGIYAAINTEDGWAICNAGIIDLGDRTLVYDCFNSPQAANDLREAAEYLTGRPARLVINSHYHNDHIWGNQSFGPEVDILSTAKTRQLIITEGAAEIKWYRETAQKQLEDLEAQYDHSSDETTRHYLKAFVANLQAIVAALPILQRRFPNLTFTGEMAFHDLKRSARLVAYEGGHCGSDAILHLPEDNIVFMEDTLFIDCHPYLADGDPDVIQHILAQVRQVQPSIVVPGHGPVGKIEHLDILDGYINRLNTLVSEAIDRGLSEEEIGNTAIPQEYVHYLFPIFFSANLKFIYQRRMKIDKGNDNQSNVVGS